MNRPSKAEESKTNKEYREIDEQKVNQKYQEARKHIDDTINKAEVKYYVSNISATGVKQGFAMGQKQAIGLFLYELQDSFFTEMKSYFAEYKLMKTVQAKIDGFKKACINIKNHMLAKAKKILVAFSDGFISGFIGNIITVFINTFATTAKNLVRILNEGVHALIKAVKILINPPKDMSKKEALFEASKILTASVITTLGLILTEAFITYLKTTPLAPFAALVGGVLGGILTGIVSVTAVYTIDNFADILKKIKHVMSNLKLSAEEIRSKYNNAITQLDTDLKKVIEMIYQEYEELHLLTANAYDLNATSSNRFNSSQKLASKLGVNDSEILKSTKDVLDFFNN